MSRSGSISPFYQSGKGLFPQEEKLAVERKQRSITIGLPKESRIGENRLSLTPEAVELLVANGHNVLVEKGAGIKVNYPDLAFSEVGATICTPAEAYKADIILKVSPPSLDEIELIPDGRMLISSFHQTPETESILRALQCKKITALSFELIKDVDECYPVVRSLSAIAGSTSILVAAEHLSNLHNGKGVMLGGITGISPTEVVIIGADTAGEYAAKAALGLGAMVKIFDASLKRLTEIQYRIGTRLYTSIFHPQVLEKALKSADVVIGTPVPDEDSFAPLIPESYIEKMKDGSVVIDLTVSMGGSFETTECRPFDKPSFVKHGVIHVCMPDITSRVARTASIALSNVFVPILLDIGQSAGSSAALKGNKGLRNGVYMYNGILTNVRMGQLYHMSATDINLLMAAF
ncbi:alanine dehydrogenase [Williamwhitmania taraxaci]|uniref:alanine dehydrogenase n=1 Tax=Williamwhitmania taraxaci TaxID=1640674 RepID=A0A1G6LX32_9BACT|nr:alanine dehydrogenase [Williamwhitmania taraxaci]SDC47771.1 alanine dehydrogenase [Williamwhitmania taraxaci]